MDTEDEIVLETYARINQFLAKNSGFTLDTLKEAIRKELQSCVKECFILVKMYRDGKVSIERRTENGGFDEDKSVFNWEWYFDMNSEKDVADFDIIFDLEFCGEVSDWLEENEL